MDTKTLSLSNPWIEILIGTLIIIISAMIGFLARDFIIDLQTNFLMADGRDWGFF